MAEVAAGPRQRLLLVEDSPDDARLFIDAAEDRGDGPFIVCHASTLGRAMEEIEAHPPEIVLLDLDLPDSDGLGTLHRVLAATPGIPVAVLTGRNDDDDALKALRAGAQDYIVKGTSDIRSVLRVLRHAMERYRLVAELEEARQWESFRATHDSLTGLANRTLFFDRLSHILARALRYRDSFAIAFIDLDDFKGINDEFGHQVGDVVLRTFATRLLCRTRTSDTLARLGGDEFAILMERIGRGTDAERHVEEILTSATEPLEIAGQAVRLRASFGISRYPTDAVEGSDLLRTADAAMYRSKQLSKRS